VPDGKDSYVSGLKPEPANEPDGVEIFGCLIIGKSGGCGCSGERIVFDLGLGGARHSGEGRRTRRQA
jgi:hypothetical protein